jgi:hypothetical protein
MQKQTRVIRTSIAAALISATHKAHSQGINTGRLGRNVLTAEAKGVGVKQYIRTTKGVAA